MLLVRGGPTESARSDGKRSVEVEVGLFGGARVRGRLHLPGSWQVHDLLNNVREPMLTLDTNGLAPGTLTVSRTNVVWVCPRETDVVGTDESSGLGGQTPHAVVIHAGPFELHGTITSHPRVDWASYLVGRLGPPAEFIALTDARLADGTELAGCSVAVNVALVAALASRD